MRSGVGFVKKNALADLDFASFSALEVYLTHWMLDADERVHGTTQEIPRVRFEREEKHLLRPLPALPLPVRERRLRRRVANDCLVNVDTVRYSVPHRLVKETVEVSIVEEEVRIFHGGELVAQHRRASEPHSKVIEPSHHADLWKSCRALPLSSPEPSPLSELGRSLADYAEVVEGGAP